MLVQPGERRLGEALHAGRGDHAVERLKEGPDEDTELMGAEELRTSLAKAMVSHPPGVGKHPPTGSRTNLPAWPWSRPAGCLPQRSTTLGTSPYCWGDRDVSVTQGRQWKSCITPVTTGSARNGCLDTRQLFQSRSRSQLVQCPLKCPGAGHDTIVSSVLPWCSQPAGATAGDWRLCACSNPQQMSPP